LYIRKNSKVHEITGLPVTHLKKLVTAPFLATDFLAIAKNRGYNIAPICESIFTLISTLPISKGLKAHAISQVLFNLNVNRRSPLFTPLDEIRLSPKLSEKLRIDTHGLYHGWLTEERYNAIRYVLLLENILDKIEDSKEFERLDHKPSVHETHPMAYAVGHVLSKTIDELLVIDARTFNEHDHRTLLQDAEVYLDGNSYPNNHYMQSRALTQIFDRKDEDYESNLLEIKATSAELLQSDLFAARFYYLTLAHKPKSKKRQKGVSLIRS
jgi:hypothetical protein